jgi:hypothetical protein
MATTKYVSNGKLSSIVCSDPSEKKGGKKKQSETKKGCGKVCVKRKADDTGKLSVWHIKKKTYFACDASVQRDWRYTMAVYKLLQCIQCHVAV